MMTLDLVLPSLEGRVPLTKEPMYTEVSLPATVSLGMPAEVTTLACLQLVTG